MSQSGPSTSKTINTLNGHQPYLELVPVLALGVQKVMSTLARKSPDDLVFSDDFILELHRDAFGNIVAWAGRPRTIDVQVGSHVAPDWTNVKTLLRQFADNLDFRVSAVPLDNMDADQLAEIFAFCEGRFTNIHPFEDFNGRVSRLLSWALVLRFRLPANMEIVPPEGDSDGKSALLAALCSFDHGDYGPLEQIWRDRLLRLSHAA